MTNGTAVDKLRRQLIAVEFLELAARDFDKARRTRKHYAVLAKDEYGLSNEAIGAALGISEAAVRQLIMRAREYDGA